MATADLTQVMPFPRRRLAVSRRTLLRSLILLLAFIASLEVGYLARTRFFAPTPPVAPTTATVARGTIQAVVATTGSVAASTQAKLGFTTAGRLAEVFVKVGDEVKVGQAVAKLDTAALEAKVAQAETGLRQAQRRLETLNQSAKAEDIAAAQATVLTAQTRLDELLRGPTAADLQDAQLKVLSAEAQLTKAQNDLTKLQAGPTNADVQAALQSVLAAQTQLSKAQTELAKLLAGPVQADVQAAREKVLAAQAQVNKAQADLARLQAGPVQADVQAAREKLLAAQTQLEKARNDLAKLQAGLSDTERQALVLDVERKRQALVRAQADYDAIASQPNAATSAQALALQQARLDYQVAQNTLATKTAPPSAADLETARRNVAGAEAALYSAQAKYDEVLAGPKFVDIENARLALASAQSSLAGAQARYDEVVAGPKAVDIENARLSVTSAQASLTAARAKYDELVAGAKPADLDAARATVNSAQLSLDSARLRLADLQAGPKASEIASARATLVSAQAALAQKVAGPEAAAVADQMDAIAAEQTKVDQARVDLGNAILTAPFDGRVAAVGAQAGEQVSSSAAVVTLLNPNQLQVTVSVDETDVPRLAVGQQAQITLDALPNRQFTGRVLSIAPPATVQSGVATYPVLISMDTRGQTVPAGMSAAVRVITSQRQDVLVVPSRAVRTQGRNRVVDVLTPAGATETRQVQVGQSDDTRTEIVSGLREGDIVIIPTTTTRQPNVTTAGGFTGGGPGGAAVPIGPR
jgi:HlyD family secretion protein